MAATAKITDVVVVHVLFGEDARVARTEHSQHVRT